jgi:hypothetical protein
MYPQEIPIIITTIIITIHASYDVVEYMHSMLYAMEHQTMLIKSIFDTIKPRKKPQQQAFTDLHVNKHASSAKRVTYTHNTAQKHTTNKA